MGINSFYIKTNCKESCCLATDLDLKYIGLTENMHKKRRKKKYGFS